MGFFSHTSPERRTRFSRDLTQEERDNWEYNFSLWAHPGQLPPEADWRIWLVMAGRGFGKTRAGAEWVRCVAERDPDARIALVAANLADARSVMVEGESGILACCPPASRPIFEPSLRRLRFPNGAEATLFSAGEPESLRGPQFSHGWCDEIAKWKQAHGAAERAWDNLLLGLRLGRSPRLMATTTPRAVGLVQRLVRQALDNEVQVTHGSTYDNAGNLPEAYMSAIASEFGGTQLARQELDGELIADIEGALWNRALIEQARENAADLIHRRVVVGVDPPASARGDACGIIVAALGEDGLAHVLADCSVEQPTPERWARAVANACAEWSADRVVAEANQGGDMVASVLRASDVAMPLKLVHASRGKAARAEPVAALYETGRVRHRGQFSRLEDEMCGMMTGGDYQGPGRSPDRADALAWALTELMLTNRATPRITEI